MSTNKKIDEQVKKTLDALNGIEPASTDPFFYSRLSAKIEHRASSDSEGNTTKEYGFAFSMAAVFLVLVLNLISISQFELFTTDTEATREDVVEELAYEYQIFDLNYYETYEDE